MTRRVRNLLPASFVPTAVLSHEERRQFDAISAALTADPEVAAASRKARRRVRRRRAWRWLAPLVVAHFEARYAARLLAGEA